MTSPLERWAVVGPAVDEALLLPDDRRAEWLAALRAADAPLADDVAAFLERNRRAEAEGFLARPLDPRATLEGQVLGAYRLRAPIGAGGMGSVWLAERADGRYEGQVAVKLLNASLVGRAAEERFAREGRILARLRHAHISRLLDAGVSPAGQPYLVLEHVDGEPVDAHCDRLRLGVDARLLLFLDVLAAVQHAHANLVVHRDLKPSNVLVDSAGSVKLLDFGIAKLLAEEADGRPRTIEGTALTPEYAAPEQLTGGDVTTATDVFALGSLLYMLLTGRHPFEGVHRDAPGELLHAVLERDPARPSAAAAGDHERAARRDGSPARLVRRLRGDLDTIVLRALKKAPAERYVSAGAFADDLRRFLTHAPIAARPDTLAYRAARFVRRHRLPAALVAVLVLALCGGLAGTLWQAQAAARERDRALAQLDRAESINEFTTFVLGQAVPGGQQVPVSEILSRAERLAEKRSTRDPALAVELLEGIGGVHIVRQESDNALRVMRRAYDLSQALPDPVLRAKAACSWARAVGLTGDQRGALALVDQGLALTSAEERFDATAARCLLDRGSIAMDLGSVPLITASAEAALARLGRREQAFPELRAMALQLTAVGRRMAGRPVEADAWFARAQEQLERLGRAESTDGAVLLHNWAMNTALTSPLAASVQTARVIALFEGGDSDSVPLLPLLNHGVHLNRLGRHAEARAVVERALVQARRHGTDARVGQAELQLSIAFRAAGELASARVHLAAAQAALPATLPADHRVRGELAREQGLVAAAEGRAADALVLLRTARAIHASLGPGQPTGIETLVELSRVALQAGARAEAEAAARDALGLAETLAAGSAQSAWVGRSLLALGTARQDAGAAEDASALLRRALVHLEPTLGTDHPDVRDGRARLAWVGPG